MAQYDCVKRGDEKDPVQSEKNKETLSEDLADVSGIFRKAEIQTLYLATLMCIHFFYFIVVQLIGCVN